MTTPDRPPVDAARLREIEIEMHACAAVLPPQGSMVQMVRAWQATVHTAADAIAAAEQRIALLRAALVALVGADGREELEQLEAAMRLIPAPAADKVASIDAIHALIASLP